MGRSGLRAVVALGLLSACTTRVRPIVQSGPSPAARIAAADAQYRAGCLECLDAALTEYLALRSDPAVGQSASESSVRTAILIAVRENELGLVDSGRLQQARSLLESPSPALALMLDVAEALSQKPAGSSRSPYSDAETRAVIRISRNHQQWSLALRQLMPGDLVADYLWVGLACGPSGFDIPDRVERDTVLGQSVQTELMKFKNASGCSTQVTPIQELLDREPRFVEANYFLARSALSSRLLRGVDEAEQRFQVAYAWRQDWPSLTVAMANLAVTAEDFERAIEFYDKTLALIPDHPDALLGRIRALTYSNRHEDAIAASDRLLAVNLNPGEARYWRALNEEQLDRHDAAWDDVERAAQGMVSPDVPKLAGLIAINRRQLDVARQRLELSLSARPSDCETLFYLQAVLTQQAQWTESARVAANAATCLDGDLTRLSGEIESLRTAEMRQDQRERQIVRHEQQMRSETRMRAASWFDAAAANYNLSRKDEAKQFAEKLLGDEQYRDRASDLLARLSP